ncbi:MAG: hypothetical protein ACRDPW_02765, partial [Mycobacteriales bacterium]
VAGFTPDGYAEPLGLALRSFAGTPADDIALLLPAPGDTRGLPSYTAASPEPVKAFVAAAVEAGCAVVHTSRSDGTLTGLIVAPIPGRMVAWNRFVLPPQPVPNPATVRLPAWASPPETMTPADADSALITALHDATAILDRLELAAGREELREQLAALRHDGGHSPHLPPGFSSRQRLRLARAGLVLGIAELATADTDGGAVDNHQIVVRAAALREITAAARAAYTATINAPMSSTGSSRTVLIQPRTRSTEPR